MDINIFETKDPEELIARGQYKQFVFYAIIFTAFCFGGLIEIFIKFKTVYSSDFLSGLLIAFIFLCIALFFWLKVFDRKTKLIINRNGIASKKSGIVAWNEIWYFHIQETFFKGRNYHFLILKTKLEKEYKIQLSYFDKTYEQIKKAIIVNSKDNSIIDLGFETNR